MGEPICGHGVLRGVGFGDESLVASIVLQGGADVLAFSFMWRKCSALGEFSWTIIFVPETVKGVWLKSEQMNRQTWAGRWGWIQY